MRRCTTVKQRGFTLIELLAVIVILAIVLAIAIPGISGVINIAKANSYKSQMQLIEDAAKKYMMDDFKYDNMKVGTMETVTLQQLYDGKFLTTVKNPSTNEIFNATSAVYVTKRSNNRIDYTYENESDCRYNGKTCLKNNVVSDLNGKSQSYQGGTYYKGTNATILNNYIWYSGQEYRIMGINSDGSIKLVTSLPLVNISWGPTGTADYTNSYARKWLDILPVGNPLKDDYEGIFYKSLNRTDLIQDYQFCIGKQDPTSSTDTTCSTKLTDKIGLMTWWEYKIAGPNANGDGSYLDVDTILAFLTADTRVASNLLTTWSNGSIFGSDGTTYVSYPLNNMYTTAGLRPTINLKASVSVISGNGTSASPYRLLGDEAGEKDDYLFSRYAGEYLNFNGIKYRIVSKNANGNTKIVMDPFVTGTSTSGGADYVYYDLGENATNVCSGSTYCNNHFDVTDGSGNYDGSQGHNIGYFLNSNAANSFYTSLGSTYQAYLDEGVYYFGTWNYGQDYELAYTSAETVGYGIQNLKVGISQYGEMFASGNANSRTNNGHFWLLNPFNNTVTSSCIIDSGYANSFAPTNSYMHVRPTLNLKAGVKIVSGTGTKNNPYEIIN